MIRETVGNEALDLRERVGVGQDEVSALSPEPGERRREQCGGREGVNGKIENDTSSICGL